MKLNEELVAAAAKVAFEATDGDNMAAFEKLAPIYQRIQIDAARNAIGHYLQNRTLPDRMREAADTLDEASERRGTNGVFDSSIWKATSLRGAADRWEAEDREEAKNYALAKEFAHALYENSVGDGFIDCVDLAQRLLKEFDITRREQS